jgi:hypothetical protein
MRSLKRAAVLIIAVAAFGMAAPSAQADIVFVQNITSPNPIPGGIGGELTHIQTLTSNNDLEVFGKSDLDSFCVESCANQASLVDVTKVSGTLYTLSWAGVTDWSLEFILVKDGNAGYSLFAVTDAQAHDGGGNIWINTSEAPACTDGTQTPDKGKGGCKDISHFTIFGVQDTTNVPEPATVLILGLGLSGLGLVARRKFRR